MLRERYNGSEFQFVTELFKIVPTACKYVARRAFIAHVANNENGVELLIVPLTCSCRLNS